MTSPSELLALLQRNLHYLPDAERRAAHRLLSGCAELPAESADVLTRSPSSEFTAPSRSWEEFVLTVGQAALSCELFEFGSARYFVLRVDAVPPLDGVPRTPIEAATRALERTRDGERGDNVWYVYDTQSNTACCLIQEDFDSTDENDEPEPTNIGDAFAR